MPANRPIQPPMNTPHAHRRLLAGSILALVCGLGSNSALAIGGSDCFLVHPLPGCGEAACASAICAHDPHCCAVTWDAFCVGYANLSCVGRLGDLNGDDVIGSFDLACLLSRWGTPAGDVTGDLTTDSADLAVVLAHWSA
jgi:hypothetical protein